MNRFSNILFVAESAPDNLAAFTQAVELAKSNQAQLTVLGVVDLPAVSVSALEASEGKLHEAILGAERDELKELLESANGSPDCEIKVAVGKKFVEVIREVVAEERDLVIKAIGPQFGVHSLFGSADMKLLRQCPCPLWLIKPTEPKGKRQILAAVDYDPENDAEDALNRNILEIATSLALSEFAELHVVHAWRLAYEKTLRTRNVGYSSATVDAILANVKTDRGLWLKELVNEHCGTKSKEVRSYLKPQTHLIKGRAGHVVPSLCAELGAELIVMGTLGRVGIPGLFIGNTAETILRQIDCSVLAVKPSGFVSPVTLHQLHG
jgi:nucleotide-binding universal stress UspA family protein